VKRVLLVLLLGVCAMGFTRYYTAGQLRRVAATAVPEITPGYNSMLVWWKITTDDADGGYVKDWSPSGANYGTQDTASARFAVSNTHQGRVCAYLDGGDYSSTTNARLLNLSTNLTLALWINRSVEIGNAGMLAMRGGEYNALHDIGNPAVGIVTYIKSTATAYPTLTNGFAGTWLHLAATYDGQNIRMFTNGILAVTTAKSGALDVSDVWRLGTDDADTPPARTWRGYLDDARIVGRCLTSQEVYQVSQEAAN
jgi:hypothetical protein